MTQPPRSSHVPDLGVRATVLMDEETHGPKVLYGFPDGLRRINVRPAEPRTGDDEAEPLAENVHIASTYSLHVALYALQNPTPENIDKALAKIGCSGDCEDWCDEDTLRPLPVPEPPSWERSY